MESIIGKVIDGYRILDVLGRGGMGVVYKALDTSLDKVMALKMIDPMLARDENFLKRFKTEARALAKLENTNIVTVHALRETEFGVFMVMEYVEAKTLSDWIQQKGPFSWEDTVTISKQLLNAIGHAHRVGVIHRDIKPSNILLDTDLRVKVTDFGLAKVIRQHGPSSTVTQMRAGTLYYMSPEQVKGLKNVDFRSDIYSLGMTLYEMMVGKTPFEKTDSDFSIQKRIVEGEIPPPTKFNSSIPKPLAKIITKAIDKNPLKRYQSAEEMNQDIQVFEDSNSQVSIKKPSQLKLPSLKSVFLVFTILLVLTLSYILIMDPLEIFSEKETISTTKKPEPVLVSIMTEPDNATIVVNDSTVGQSPINQFKINAGSIALQLMKDGFQSIDTVLTVRAGQNVSYSFTLKQKSETVLVKNLGIVQIQSTPNEAGVWINNRFIGTTPREKEELRPGRYNLVVRKRGYAEYRDAFVVRTDQTTEINIKLEMLGKLNIYSQPAGADVLLDGNSIGSTPISEKELKQGSYRISIRKEGYEEYSTSVSVTGSSVNNVSKTLTPLTGSLKILIRPWGSVYVDGVLQKKDTNIQFETSLPVGLHKLKAQHPALGEWERQIKIEGNKTLEYVIDFNQTAMLTVTSEPNGCEIYIDGEASGKYTPKQLKLRIGKHVLSVQKSGYMLPGGEMQINIEEDVRDPLHFKLIKIQ
ncbi:MAG: serine/threonine protein kinase [bacterium]|nr:MAG: serine/threonine protein kinase [bacterium]